MKKTLLKNKITIAVLLVLVVILSITTVGLTYAWFTDRETSESQVIKFGKINIDVTSNVYRSSTTEVVETLMPGDELDIKYTLANTQDSEAAWVLTYVALNSPSLSETELQQFSSINGWYEGSSKATENSCLSLAKGNTGTDYTIELTISPDIENEMAEKYMILEVFTFAIQQANLTEAEAYSLLLAEYNNYIEELSADTFTLRGTVITGLKDGVDLSTMTTLTIPEGVTAIQDGYIEDTVLSEGVGHLDLVFLGSADITEFSQVYSFINMTITKVELSSTFKILGNAAFTGFVALSEIDLSGVESIGDLALAMTAITGANISKNVTSIRYAAFFQCSALTTVTFESGSKLTNIGDYAFGDCTSLESLTIPSSVTSIGECAFIRCSALSTISFVSGSKLESIGGVAFWQCKSLQSITIPASVTSIGECAFGWCESLIVNFMGTEDQWNSLVEGNDIFHALDPKPTVNFNYAG